MKKNNVRIYNTNTVQSLRGRAVEEWQEVLWVNFLAELLKVNSKKRLKEVLESLLSEDEKKTILRRLAATALIRQGKSYKEIGKILWVSPATVSAIKKNLLSKSPNHRSHRSVYQRKSQLGIFNENKKSVSEKVVDFITQAAENAAHEFSRSGLTLPSYARSLRKIKNKS